MLQGRRHYHQQMELVSVFNQPLILSGIKEVGYTKGRSKSSKLHPEKIRVRSVLEMSTFF